MKLFFLTLTLLLLIGCASEEEVSLLDKYSQNILYHKQLKHTEKTQLYENNTSKALLTATYLYTPSHENNDSQDEVFVVGVHLEDEAYSSVENDGYSLTLNRKLPKEVVPLAKNDVQLKQLSFVTQW